MPLVPYDPFGIMRRDFGSIPSFPRLFDDAWFEEHFANMPQIRMDVRESLNEVIVTAELPGLERKEDVKITVHDNHLHLSGKIERMGEQGDENVHRMERYYGQFSRTISLPTGVDDTGAKASYRNGILEVRIPRSQKQIDHQIDIDFH